MGRRLYVGNLSFSATEDELREHFAQAGNPESATATVALQPSLLLSLVIS